MAENWRRIVATPAEKRYAKRAAGQKVRFLVDECLGFGAELCHFLAPAVSQVITREVPSGGTDGRAWPFSGAPFTRGGGASLK